VEVLGMYVVFVKDDGQHTVKGILESVDEVKELIKQEEIRTKIETGKAYLIEGDIKLIRPEITPELLDLKVKKKEKDMYY
jgi:small nuclear ribonucleoprotein (snRNP)-like protein